jgi:hypothetical protein
MKSYEAESLVDASPETIWAILTEASKYANWDSGVERVEGNIASGETISVYSKISPGRAFPVKVIEFLPGQKMVWSGGMPMGLFKGVRTFTLSPDGKGLTKFKMREEFSGLMLPLIWGSMPDLGPSFKQFAAGLKSRAESKGATV